MNQEAIIKLSEKLVEIIETCSEESLIERAKTEIDDCNNPVCENCKILRTLLEEVIMP